MGIIIFYFQRGTPVNFKAIYAICGRPRYVAQSEGLTALYYGAKSKRDAEELTGRLRGCCEVPPMKVSYLPMTDTYGTNCD